MKQFESIYNISDDLDRGVDSVASLVHDINHTMIHDSIVIQ